MKKSKKSSEVWKCKHNCPVTKIPCKHLEKLIKKPIRGKGLKPAYESNSLKLATSDDKYHEKAVKLEAELRKFFVGYDSFRVDLIMDRYVSNLTLMDIASLYGYTSSGAVQHLIKSSLHLLRANGSLTARRLLGDYE